MTIFEKIKVRFWAKLVKLLRHTGFYYFLYFSYLYSLWKPKKNVDTNNYKAYFTAKPNQGAGIGHQIANWIAGFWFAKQFGLQYVHSFFSNPKWEYLLGFGNDEITVEELKKQGFKKVLLPLFDEQNTTEIEKIKKIIAAYSNKKVIFICELDQFYRNQYGVLNEIQHKFYKADARKNDNLIYDKNHFNVAIHVRRGDIVVGQVNKNPNLLLRWQNNDYFTIVLANALKLIETDKPIHIFLFSQGIESDFEDFKTFENIHFCLEMNAQNSFLHMVYADMLITSKSSFSYKPALLNKGLKICPKEFWHGYPSTSDWILADETGSLIKTISLYKD